MEYLSAIVFKYISNNLHPDVNSQVTLIDSNGKHKFPDDNANCFLCEFSKNFNVDVFNSASVHQQPINVERSILL